MTSLKQIPLTNNEFSMSFEITITALSKSNWTQHCSVEAQALADDVLISKQKFTSYARRVNTSKWYNEASKLGLKLGSQFKTLDSITADPTETKAVAAIRKNKNSCQPSYAVHPTVIDACLQLISIAGARGRAHHLQTLRVPSTMNYITVKATTAELSASAVSQATIGGAMNGNVTAMNSKGEVVIQFSNATLQPLDSVELDEEAQITSTTRLEWRHDINYSNPSNYILQPDKNIIPRLLIEKFTCLGLLRSSDALASLPPLVGHLSKQLHWLLEQKALMRAGVWDSTVPRAQYWESLDGDHRERILSTLWDELRDLNDKSTEQFCRMVVNLSDSRIVRDVFTRKLDAINVLIEDGGLSNIYDMTDNTKSIKNLLALYAHAQPTQRILEIDAGTGGATAEVLKALCSEYGQRMYSEYVYTDISSGFFNAAKERFAHNEAITYKTLDISSDPIAQGFERGGYDFILATNVSL